MSEPKVSQLTAAATDLLARLERYEYTSITSPTIKISNFSNGAEPDIELSLYAEDDFQNKIGMTEYNLRVQVGYLFFPYRAEHHQFHIPSVFLSRPQREAHVLAGKLGKTLEITKLMKAAFVEEFISRMAADMERFKLIPPPNDPF